MSARWCQIGRTAVLNLYLVPRLSKSGKWSDQERLSIKSLLSDLGIIGKSLTPWEFAPGLGVAHLFPSDAEQHKLPGELTFESLSIISVERDAFLPRQARLGALDGALCPVCDDEVDPAFIDLSFDKMNFLALDAVRYECPSCCVDQQFSQLNFDQPTAVSKSWIFIEGAAFGRLNPSVIEKVSRLLNAPLLVVPEVPEDEFESRLESQKSSW